MVLTGQSDRESEESGEEGTSSTQSSGERTNLPPLLSLWGTSTPSNLSAMRNYNSQQSITLCAPSLSLYPWFGWSTAACKLCPFCWIHRNAHPDAALHLLNWCLLGYLPSLIGLSGVHLYKSHRSSKRLVFLVVDFSCYSLITSYFYIDHMSLYSSPPFFFVPDIFTSLVLWLLHLYYCR